MSTSLACYRLPVGLRKCCLLRSEFPSKSPDESSCIVFQSVLHAVLDKVVPEADRAELSPSGVQVVPLEEESCKIISVMSLDVGGLAQNLAKVEYVRQRGSRLKELESCIEKMQAEYLKCKQVEVKLPLAASDSQFQGLGKMMESATHTTLAQPTGGSLFQNLGKPETLNIFQSPRPRGIWLAAPKKMDADKPPFALLRSLRALTETCNQTTYQRSSITKRSASDVVPLSQIVAEGLNGVPSNRSSANGLDQLWANEPLWASECSSVSSEVYDSINAVGELCCHKLAGHQDECVYSSPHAQMSLSDIIASYEKESPDMNKKSDQENTDLYPTTDFSFHSLTLPSSRLKQPRIRSHTGDFLDSKVPLSKIISAHQRRSSQPSFDNHADSDSECCLRSGAAQTLPATRVPSAIRRLSFSKATERSQSRPNQISNGFWNDENFKRFLNRSGPIKEKNERNEDQHINSTDGIIPNTLENRKQFASPSPTKLRLGDLISNTDSGFRTGKSSTNDNEVPGYQLSPARERPAYRFFANARTPDANVSPTRLPLSEIMSHKEGLEKNAHTGTDENKMPLADLVTSETTGYGDLTSGFSPFSGATHPKRDGILQQAPTSDRGSAGVPSHQRLFSAQQRLWPMHQSESRKLRERSRSFSQPRPGFFKRADVNGGIGKPVESKASELPSSEMKRVPSSPSSQLSSIKSLCSEQGMDSFLGPLTEFKNELSELFFFNIFRAEPLGSGFYYNFSMLYPNSAGMDSSNRLIKKRGVLRFFSTQS